MDVSTVALVISLLTFVAGVCAHIYTKSETSIKTEIDILKEKCLHYQSEIEELKNSHRECTRELKRLTSENIELMRKLLSIPAVRNDPTT